MSEFQVLLVWTLCWTLAEPLKLPDYITPCRRYDPDVDQCVLKQARATIPHITNGDPKYRVPPLEPILVKELIVNQGTSSVGMSIVARDAYMRGIKGVELKNFRNDWKNNKAYFDWHFPEIRIDCMYNVTGKILLLPIEGHGKGTISLRKVDAKYTFEWEFMKKKDGKEYYYLKNSNLTFEPQDFHINLENLFNGNKLLGDNMNDFMNENWREIVKDVGPAMADALSEYIRHLLNNIFSLVPKEDVYLYDPV